ncbi:MAG: hypothetical protein K8T26_19620 [Lentisphaerae bacterium]|nr:hypothetical protein [Lentisphaerota bacterium]
MHLAVQTETGETPPVVPRLRCFLLELNKEDQAVRATLDDAVAELRGNQWQQLQNAFRRPSLSRWQQREPPPFDDEALWSLCKRIESTPVYQLFLAAIDILSVFQLLYLSPDNDVENQLILGESFSDIEIGSGHGRGLYFLPKSLIISAPLPLFGELVATGKVGRAILSIEDAKLATHYYVPYSPPVTSATRLSLAAQDLWTKIKSAKTQSVRRAQP